MKDMAKTTTISVREDVKKRPDRMRKGKDWSSFLLELAEKADGYEKAKAMEEPGKFSARRSWIKWRRRAGFSGSPSP